MNHCTRINTTQLFLQTVKVYGFTYVFKMVLKYSSKLKSVRLNVLLVCLGTVRINNGLKLKGSINVFIQKGVGVATVSWSLEMLRVLCFWEGLNKNECFVNEVHFENFIPAWGLTNVFKRCTNAVLKWSPWIRSFLCVAIVSWSLEMLRVLCFWEGLN